MGRTVKQLLKWIGAPLLAAVVLLGRGMSAEVEQRPALRVCADPDNLPFSNREGRGIENKIAILVAGELGRTVSYFWWPHRRGFIRNTIKANECDVVLGVPEGMDMFLTTKPYYRSAFQFVSRADRDLKIASFDDPRLRQLKIGIATIGYDYTNSPAAIALGARGITGLVGFSTFYNEQNRPGDIVDAVVKGTVDVSIVWGPVAGYYAKQVPLPLALQPLPDIDERTKTPFAFGVVAGVRKSDKDLAAQIQAALDRKRDEISRLLAEYNFPLSHSAAPAARPTDDPGLPANHKKADRKGRAAGKSDRESGRKVDKLLVSPDEYQGWKWFHVYCFRCHGIDAVGTTLAPNLVNSTGPQGSVTHDVFLKTVKEGRPDKGMQSWTSLLDDSQIEQLYLYVKARSDGRLAPGRPHKAPGK
jgi:mxaJ protein